MRNNTELKGNLISYDSHLNIILSQAEETQVQSDGQRVKRRLDAIYLRGDGIVLVSPLSKGMTEAQHSAAEPAAKKNTDKKK